MSPLPRNAGAARAWALAGAAVAALVAALGLWQQKAAPPAAPPPAAPAAAPASAPSSAKPVGFVDAPAEPTLVGRRIALSGWVVMPAGVARVDVRLDGSTYAARSGLPREDVARVHPALEGAATSGFAFDGDFGDAVHGRHEVVVVAVDRHGAEHELGRRTLLAPERFARWSALLRAHPGLASPPFWVLPATSGLKVQGADGIRETFAPYASATQRAGVRVPILYMRTTKGRAHDWVFDPGWDFDRRCGERRIADDALGTVIAYAVAQRLPVMFTLNGGIWGDASCDVPDWDVNDALEQEKANCQWTARDEVPPDTALRDLPGSQSSPEIARALTLNVYAAEVRRYKKRNLQASAAIVARFAREHPELYAGVSLDPDVYIIPWWQGAEMFDYNPGTLRQFREWLQGSGPYAGRGGPGVPDLRRYRLAKPLTLADVRRLAGRDFARWEDVEPPRSFPRPGEQREVWAAPWPQLWDQFRRHLVQVHYAEIAQWAIDAGLPADQVYTAQAFVGPDPGYLPQPITVHGPGLDTDSGGVSVEGAIPPRGRLGVILYGENARNDALMQGGESTFRIFERMAGTFGVVEFSTASLKKLDYLPTYADAYKSFRELANHGALLVSPMAWNGSNGIYAGQPGYLTYTSWRNTPAEQAAFDFMLERANVPATTKLWTFGTTAHADADGWTAATGRVEAGRGRLAVAPAAGRAVLESPEGLYVRAAGYGLAVLAVDGPPPRSIDVEARVDGSGRWVKLAHVPQTSALARTPAGWSIPLAWPREARVADRLRVTLSGADAAFAVDHVALYPRVAAVRR